MYISLYVNLNIFFYCRSYINPVTKVNITSSGRDGQHVSPDMMGWEDHDVISMVFLSKVCNLNTVMRKHQMNSSEGVFYKITGLDSTVNVIKVNGSLNNCSSLEAKETWQLIVRARKSSQCLSFSKKIRDFLLLWRTLLRWLVIDK